MDIDSSKRRGELFSGFLVNNFFFSPDGRYFVAMGKNKLARIWETTNWYQIALQLVDFSKSELGTRWNSEEIKRLL